MVSSLVIIIVIFIFTVVLVAVDSDSCMYFQFWKQYFSVLNKTFSQLYILLTPLVKKTYLQYCLQLSTNMDENKYKAEVAASRKNDKG